MALLEKQPGVVTQVTRLRVPWRVPARALVTPVAALALAAAAALTAQAAYATRALPGVVVAGVDVGGLPRAAVRERLAQRVASTWSIASVTARIDGEAWTASNAELGIAPDVDAATDSALAYGKRGSPLQRLLAWVGALAGQAQLPLALRAEGDALDRQVARIASAVDRPAVDGEIALAAQGLALREPVSGRVLDRAASTVAYLAATALGDREIALQARAVHPALDAAGFAGPAAFARAVTTPLNLAAEGRSVDEVPAGLATLLTVELLTTRPGELPAVPADAVAPAVRYRYHVALDGSRVRTWIAAAAALLDRPARNATYALQPDGSLAVVPGQMGVRVDQDALVAAALRELVTPTVAPRVLVPTFVTDTPTFATEQAERYLGQMTRVTSFETFFPPNLARWKNISTGAAQFEGAVIGPGETFSFWERLGPVTVQRGYAFAGAIIDGRSQDDVIGGGLCQVSTTLFNAVAATGYEILARAAHAYYIDRYPLGLDAAVFDPGVDFKWRNDTAFPVLIRASTSNIAVEFELYTVPSGRSVAFGAPIQTSWRDVAPGQAADPHFPPGSKVLGRTVTRSRVVTEEGRMVHEDVWVSHYAPVWGGPATAN